MYVSLDCGKTIFNSNLATSKLQGLWRWIQLFLFDVLGPVLSVFVK